MSSCAGRVCFGSLENWRDASSQVLENFLVAGSLVDLALRRTSLI